MTSARATLQALARQAMQDRGFEPDLPAAAVAQLDHLHPSTAPPRRDLRDRLWCSIDNDDSRDLDQLTVAESRPDGTAILVAIADVDALVARDSPIDIHAAHNTTSVYTPATMFPMLPAELSTDRTSLASHEDRGAIVAECLVDAGGSVTAWQFYAATVRNRAKLAYSSVGPWLEGQGPLPAAIGEVPGLDANVRRQDEVAQALRQQRHQRGALTLSTLETRPVFEGDALREVTVDHANRATQLIEDFMIAANTATARFLDEHGLCSLRRVVKTPARWERIVALAAETGTTLPGSADAPALERWLLERQAADPGRFADLSLAVVKLLGRGEYAVDPPGASAPGHFGLAVPDYTHATAPNRRFADLVTQRLIKSALAGAASPYSEGELDAIARHCTEREDAANRVERQVRKSAAALLLQPRIGEIFDAIVTGASNKGVWVRLQRPMVEGRVERGGAGLEVGQRVRVRLIGVDAAKGFIDFAAIERSGSV
jgi:exoribonuclease-2